MLRKKLNLANINHQNEDYSEGGSSKKPRHTLVEPKGNDYGRLISESDYCMETRPSKYFTTRSANNNSTAEDMVELQKSLNAILEGISFLKLPIKYVYNPTIYASEPFEKYIHLYCNSEKKLIFLGMNPGPWGMCQTGVPFGEVNSVKSWLQIDGNVEQPEIVCSTRKIEGFNCKRKEISGYRFWTFFKELCGTPEKFFKNAILINYCPVALMNEKGANITPADMEISIRKSLEDACNKTVVEIIKLLKPEIIVGIGRYAEERAKVSAKCVSFDIKVIYMPHPSPRSPNNTNWHEKADIFVKENNLMSYFQ